MKLSSKFLNRRNINFRTSNVVDILPEHFRDEYPTFINFLETYYNYLDSDGNYGDVINELILGKDIDGVAIEFLELLLKQVAEDFSVDTFRDPREIIKILPDFYRYKGSLYSAKLFFRMLYAEDVDITYPKDNLIVVGESNIGPDDLKVIQNGALYQTLSILIKSTKPISKWRTLYKKYTHPAGFYLGSEVLIENSANISFGTLTDSAGPAPDINIVGMAAFNFTPSHTEPLTGIFYDRDTDSDYPIYLERKISHYTSDSSTGQYLLSEYINFADIINPNSKTADDATRMTADNIFETMDFDLYNNKRVQNLLLLLFENIIVVDSA